MPDTVAAPLTVAALPGFAARRHPDRLAMRFKRDGAWHDRDYGQVAREVDRLAAGMVAHGVRPGDRICILADTRPEWTIAAYAVWAAGGIVVPVYPTNAPEECAWVAGDSGAVAVIVDSAAQLEKIAAVRERLPALRSVLVTGGADIEPAGAARALEDVTGTAAEAGEAQRRCAAVAPADPALIIYTSGTTGPPKGCTLSHRNAMSVCAIALAVDVLLPDDLAYLYLPLAHVFAQIVQLAAFQVGAGVAYYGGDTKQIIPELVEVRPAFLPSVPRIFEKLHALAMAQVPPEEQDALRRAVQVGMQVRALEARGAGVPDELRKAYAPADERVFSRVRALFGGEIRECLTGAAPIAVEILEFFYAAGVPVMEAYGLTETMGIATANLRSAFEFGTVGRPLPGVELAIAPDGEILVRGPQVFMGYWQDQAATREVLDADGWLHTGDVGAVDDGGYLRVTGRKKDIIITAGGKNLAPANVENDLKRSPFISQAVMYGDRRPYPVALVTLDPDAVLPWARERGLPEDLAALARHPQARALVQQALDAANRRYAQVEQVKRFEILDHDLSEEAGELTPTLKVRRRVVYDRYADVFDALYAS
jgi:long-chain acyl-CoA synthetase